MVAIERVFTQNNKGTAMGTAQAAGVAALAAAQADRPVAWHTPSEVKAAISGNGRADKEQVTLMVTRVLGLADGAPSPADAADALALAVCHAWRGPAQAAAAHRGASPAASAPRSGRRPCRAGRGWRPDDRLGRAAGWPRCRPDGAVVEVGGIGLAVQCTPGTIARLQVGESARLSTSLIVREDSLTLYGFADDDERSLFELLQTANGVGPAAGAGGAGHPPAARGPPRGRRWPTSRRSCRCRASARRAPSG